VHGDGKFAYLSTEDDLFTVYEVMELVSERHLRASLPGIG